MTSGHLILKEYKLILKLTFKTPDVMDQVDVQSLFLDLDNNDTFESREHLEEHIREKLSKWIEYGEYVRIEFDLDKGTATVL